MFAYPCPFCQQRLLASPERIGQRTICPKCLKPIMIPRPEGAPVEEGRITVPELLGDTPSTIFVDDHAEESDADGMNLSLPEDHDGFSGFPGDPEFQDYDLPPAMPMDEPLPVAASPPGGAFAAPAMALAAAGVVPASASPHLGGLGASPTAFTAQDTPMPQAAPRAPAPRDNGVVVFQANVAESADIAADLTAALTMRMKPPPEPPSDLRFSTGAWLGLTATGLSLWMVSMMQPKGEEADRLLNYVGAIGVLEMIVSYVWVAYLSGRKNARRGFEALLPPVWIYRLANPCENTPGYRPLRFAVAGLLLIAVALFGGQLRPAVQTITGEPEPATPEIPKPINSPLSRLKDAENEGINRPLTDALGDLAKDKAAFTATEAEKPLLLAELRRLRLHESGEVRAAALFALKKWAGLDAVKPDVLAVLRTKHAEVHERRTALDIAREYKDRDIARAVVLCLGYRGFLDDTDRRAADTLRAIGPPEAEDALLEHFEDEDLLLRGLPAVLADLGGPKSIARLRIIAQTSVSKEVRSEAVKTADKIAARLGVEK